MSHTLWTKKTTAGEWAVDVDDSAHTADVTLNGKHLDNHVMPAPTDSELAQSGYRLTAIGSSLEGVREALAKGDDK